jgi:hypothetical protein
MQIDVCCLLVSSDKLIQGFRGQARYHNEVETRLVYIYTVLILRYTNILYI